MHDDLVTAYIGLGSNLGDRAGNLLLAVRGLMEASFGVNKLSGIYETEPIGIDADNPPKFLNMVAEIKMARVTPSQMMARLLRIEYLLGRRDKSLKRSRNIDLDLLFFGDAVVNTEFLTLPHPRLHLRRFVLAPLDEIAPNLRHPTIFKDITTILKDCLDKSDVYRWNPNHGITNGNTIELLDLQAANR